MLNLSYGLVCLIFNNQVLNKIKLGINFVMNGCNYDKIQVSQNMMKYDKILTQIYE